MSWRGVLDENYLPDDDVVLHAYYVCSYVREFRSGKRFWYEPLVVECAEWNRVAWEDWL
jgi:hypothetical protein